MKKLLLVLTISLFAIAQTHAKHFCFIQVLSSKDGKKTEEIFSEIKEFPATYLLKYGKVYTIRIGPFEDFKACKFRSKYLKEKYKYLGLNPIVISRSYQKPPEDKIVKTFQPQNSSLQKPKEEKENKKVTSDENEDRKLYLLYLEKAKICMGRKDCQNAIKYLSLAIKKNPKNPLLYTYLGYAYSHVGNYTKAIESFRKALEINPNFAEAYAGMGYLYLQLHAPNVAAIAFRKAHEIKPNDIIYSVNYAISLLEAQKYQDAKKLFKELKNKYPFLPEIYFNEAILYLKLKNYSKAAEDLKLFIEMTKQNNYYSAHRKTAEKLLKAISELAKG